VSLYLHEVRELLLTALDWVFVAGSGMLSLSIALNAVSGHATCTAVYVAIAAVAGIACASIRTLGRISWLAWIGLFAILTASKITPFFVDDHGMALTDIYYSSHCHHRRRCSRSSGFCTSGRNLGI
jgi:predicted membrane-bound dolichyl-phosphate-mannose-protein mannosyltransferase